MLHGRRGFPGATTRMWGNRTRAKRGPSCSTGFTLIEMLIVVAIIGILASIVVVGLNTSRKQARDTRRLADLRGIQTALELYYNKNGYYPGGIGADLQTVGITVPVDPLTGAPYSYTLVGSVGSPGNSYSVCYTPETPPIAQKCLSPAQ